MSTNEEYFGLDNPGIKTSNFPRWEIVKGKTYRFAIGVENIAQAFVGRKTHYFNKKRFACLSAPGKKAVCCSHEYGENGKAANEPKYRFGTVVVVYELNSQNQITDIQVLPWYFNDQVWHQLKSINDEFPLNTVDLKLVAVDPQMMKFTITNYKDCVWRKSPKLTERVIAEGRDFVEALPKRVCSKMSESDISEHLGLGDGSIASDSASGADISGIVDDI